MAEKYEKIFKKKINEETVSIGDRFGGRFVDLEFYDPKSFLLSLNNMKFDAKGSEYIFTDNSYNKVVIAKNKIVRIEGYENEPDSFAIILQNKDVISITIR